MNGRKQLFMGVDIGTSGVRAALFSLDGTQVSLVHQEYPMICTEQGMGELDPEQVFSSFIYVIKNCIESSGSNQDKIEAIGLSTQLFSLLAVDDTGRCLTNVFTWADTRAVNQAEAVTTKYDFQKIYYHTGCRGQHPMYPLGKLLWLKETKPEIFVKAYKFISIKEYILFRLFHEYRIDMTDASTTGCFNIHTFEWDPYILEEVLGVGREKFGQVAEGTFSFHHMDPVIAAEMGIRTDIPVVIGSGDGMLANVGCGVFDDTSMSCTIGTSGALRITVDKPLLDPMQRTWCYCFTRESWVAGGAINNGGIVLKWLREQSRQQFEHELKSTGENSIYSLFDRYVREIEPGSENLTFLPFLTGERSPNWNANAKGVLYGLRLGHGQKHIIRAAMEGVMFRLFSVFEVLTEINPNAKQIKCNGGYVNSDVWLQMQSDIFNREIAVSGISEASAFGAAYIAMVGVNAVKDLQTRLQVMEPVKIIRPLSENIDVYQKAYRQFKDIYSRLASSF